MIQRAWAGLVSHIYADGRLGDIQPVGEAPGAYELRFRYRRFSSCRIRAGPSCVSCTGVDRLPSSKMPALEQALHGGISYHIRPGIHDVLPFDWTQYLKFLALRFSM